MENANRVKILQDCSVMQWFEISAALTALTVIMKWAREFLFSNFNMKQENTF
jgi:hypothetical protein